MEASLICTLAVAAVMTANINITRQVYHVVTRDVAFYCTTVPTVYCLLLSVRVLYYYYTGRLHDFIPTSQQYLYCPLPNSQLHTSVLRIWTILMLIRIVFFMVALL